MVVIAVDASHTTGSVALARDGDFVAGERFGEGSSHLVGLGAAVESLLARYGLAGADIERVALVIGPGSFTGLRIALSWVKGLHAARGVDIVTLGTLELLALPHLGQHARVCPIIDARRGEIYGALYAKSAAGDGDVVVQADEVVPGRAAAPRDFFGALPDEPMLFVGTGAAAYGALLDERGVGSAQRIVNTPDVFPSTPYFAAIAHRLTPLARESIGALEPVYLRSPAAVRSPLGPVTP